MRIDCDWWCDTDDDDLFVETDNGDIDDDKDIDECCNHDHNECIDQVC